MTAAMVAYGRADRLRHLGEAAQQVVDVEIRKVRVRRLRG